MKIIITGAGGQLGYDLKRVLSPKHEVIAWDKAKLDVSQEHEVMQRIVTERPDVVVHAAAYTNVDRAESEKEAAYHVNALGALHLANACLIVGAKLVYVSTDYVFDGTKRSPYDETDTPNPLNSYGQSKLLGEKFVAMTCRRHFIVRTSWLYGQKGTNFVTKVLEKARTNATLSIVDDQFGSPTYCLDLAIFIRSLIETDHYGLYHASNQGVCSRYEFAKHILEAAGMAHISLNAVPTHAFPPAPAERPMYTAFAHKAMQSSGFARMRDWKSALDFFLQVEYYETAVKAKKVTDIW
ncbi:dTDP-4-dehydrorhamnose reductase [Paenibacillus qinlingensis]|uniref:dTDP-4-dehydrorhamnose reductase n=1 Tax=Paenibacillus qinlingensis TaxID=1837343 RepID=A0ABU1P4D3_9BACL|nr:dTDP-4-dehydrorhamnose reductase [Paenibacillus qinlingensis]MDR6553927.1 dTDP-4-dehydrorhamnose reductase [Paenibacillus qinlingensis]